MGNQKKLHELYSVAIDVFSEYGYKKATIEEIAFRMGLTKGAIYQYVDSKKSLYEESLRYRMLEWHNGVIKVIEEQTETRNKFIAMCKKAFNFLDEDIKLKKIMVNDPDIFPMSFEKDPYKSINEMSMVFLKEILDNGVKENKFKIANTEILTKLLFSMYKMIVITTYLLEEQDAQQVIDVVIETITNGIYNENYKEQ